MDFFYKPPMQRPDECEALEENYINCLVQKSLKDRVFTNKCVMDSILWFHLECPRHAQAFDDPSTFKLKFRDFFAHQKHDAQILYEKPEHLERLRKEYDTYPGPDAIHARSEVGTFISDFKQFNPDRVLDMDGQTDSISTFWDKTVEIPNNTRQYQEPRPAPSLSVDDSAKFGSAKPGPF